jgi:hypothetical protein
MTPANPSCKSFNTTINNPPTPPGLTQIYAMPDDTPAGLSTYGALKVGNGVLDPTPAMYYWQEHHNASATSWPAKYATRYAAYLAEAAGSEPWITTYEPHAPTCAKVATGTTDRRIISAAIVNCIANGVQGHNTTSVQSNAYGEFFLTRPADANIYTEFVRMITPQTDLSKLHQIVELVR